VAWTPVPHPYDKYVSEDPNAYTSVDPNLIKAALAQAGLGTDVADSVFTSFQNSQGGGVSGGGTPKPSGSTAPNAPAVDYKSLIENDPFYQQAKADSGAQGISNAAQRAQAIKKAIIDWGVMPDWATAADKLGLSPELLGYIQQDIDPNTANYAAQNEAQGLSRHARLEAANKQNIDAIRNQLAARGMYQSGELGYGLTENAQQYKQAATDAEGNVIGAIAGIGQSYASAEAQRKRDLASAGQDAAGRVATQVGSSGATTGGTTPAGGTNPGGTSSFLLPAKTSSVWDVNTASTNDAINAAKASGGSVTIRPDDPEAVTKANTAAQAGVPVSIQVNGSADDTPETLAARVKQYQTQFPGASMTLDLESPNYRGYAGTAGGDATAAYAQAVMQAAPNTPLVITTEGVADFNYAAWAQNPNVIFAPQAYWGDMTPRDVSEVVSLLVKQGVPVERIIPVVAPGQSLGSWTGPVSVYGAPTSGQQGIGVQQPGSTPYAALPGTPIGDAQQNATQTSSTYSPDTIQKILAQVAGAYKSPDETPLIKTGGMF
jgi:(2Fe-2S) ferredoxin